jgi:hypothetical protein
MLQYQKVASIAILIATPESVIPCRMMPLPSRRTKSVPVMLKESVVNRPMNRGNGDTFINPPEFAFFVTE